MSTDAAQKLVEAERLAAAAVSATTPEQLAEIARRFNAHPADDLQLQRMANVRMACLQTAEAIVNNVPASRERSTALTLLEQVMFEANAGVSRPPQASSL